MKLSKSIFSPAVMPLLLLLWVIAGCLIPNVWLSASERMPMWPTVTNVVLPAGLYIWLMSLSPKIGKSSLWMSILFVFAAFQLVLLYMYGRSPIAVDMYLNVATTNPGEVNELLGNLVVIMFCVIAIYLPPIILAIVAAVRRWRLTPTTLHTGRRTSWVLLIIGFLCFGLSFTSPKPYNPLCDLYPLNVFYNLEVAIHRTVRVANYHSTSAAYSFNARSLRPDSLPEAYVVVIGETSRAENWQLLGYQRPTTPELIGRPGLVAFDKAISQSNTTHKSVPMLLSQLDASTFGDSIYYAKSLITAFNEAGFDTWFISNQRRNHSFIDFFGEEADSCIFIKDDESKSNGFDTDMLPYLDNALRARKNKTLVVLHAYGSHFNYVDRYPADSAFFKPDHPTGAAFAYRNNLINAYDNTIRLTSRFLAGVIDRLEADSLHAALIYTSDHGEDIYDDSRHLFLHASPIPSYHQIHVPFLIWFSDTFRAHNPAALPTAQANSHKFVASSQAYFHTIMQMAGIATPRLTESASLLSPSYLPTRPIYLNDHNDAVDLINCGILEPDLKALDNLSIPRPH